MDARAKITALRDQIAGLEVARCRLSHERVLHDKASGLPVLMTAPLPSYQRVGLCPREVRSRRLTCGHTMARYLLQHALEAIGPHDGEGGRRCEALRTELSAVTDEIHQLDHRRGDVEATRARLIEDAHRHATAASGAEEAAQAELASAAAQIREVELRHDACVERMSRVMSAVLALLDVATTG